ncbi:hypothetical protein ACIPK7_05240 [Pseudomonas sp. NPDC086581]|uniref:hypothetical protein n=1 Tax=Pseudomonas sp. NPDC086581 TaxID=3364432 RepID=UPI003829869B
MKAELAEWHALLNKRRELMISPDYHCRTLSEGARGMLARGVIDAGEWFELAELVTAAYSFAVEERASELFHPASQYLVQDQGLARVGSCTRSVLAFDADRRSPLSITHGEDGKLHAYGGPAFSWLSGTIEGLTLVMENGRRFELVEVGRYIEGGVFVQTITDPESFRLLLDVIEHAQEDGAAVRAKHLQARAEVSVFCLCPACRDHFAKREECSRCEGRGFVDRVGQTRPSAAS